MKIESGIHYTPKEIVNFCINILNPTPNLKILDPACGTGNFLKGIIDYYYNKNIQIDLNKIFGIDIDSNIYSFIKQDEKYSKYIKLINSDSLKNFNELENIDPNLKPNFFDVILTNPPYGNKLNSLKNSISNNGESSEILFLKKSLKFLKHNGKMAIILPDKIFRYSNSKILDFIKKESTILAVISIPHFAFVNYGSKTKTSILFLQKNQIPELNYNLFMAIPKQIGIDGKGRKENNDFNLIEQEYNRFLEDKEHYIGYDPNYDNVKFFSVNESSINNRLNPEFYDPHSVWKTAIKFERHVLTLIDAISKRENKEFNSNYKVKKDGILREFDGYAPNGICDFNGPLIVEVKQRIHGIRDLDKLIKRLEILNNINTLLIITDNLERTGIPNESFLKNNIKIIFWDNKDLKMLEEKFPEVAYPITKDLNGAVKHWKNVSYNTNRNSLINEIAKKDNLVLFLGAGCSIGDKIPNWDTLLKDLLFEVFNETVIDEDILKGLDQIKKGTNFPAIQKKLDNSNLMLGRFIKEMLDDRFTEQTQKSIYNNDERDSCGNNTLNALSDFIKNNQDFITGIVTYNFDDLLEYYLDERNINHKTIYHGGINPSNDEIPIYHVHGYLPKDINVKNDCIIFSEKEYHHQYGDPHSWRNLIPLKFLRENTILFIGLSMDDPNLRRLLDIGYRYFNNPKHYLIFSKERWDDPKSCDETISNIFREMEEITFRDLGLKIMWLKDYDEIDFILNKITKARHWNKYEL